MLELLLLWYDPKVRYSQYRSGKTLILVPPITLTSSLTMTSQPSQVKGLQLK